MRIAVLALSLGGGGLSLAEPQPAPTPSVPSPPAGLEATALLDARAPLFAAIHPTDLGDGFALMDLLGGIFPDTMRAMNRVRDGLGLYAFSRGEFSESGVDPDAVVLASWGLSDGDRAPATFVRHRFVIKTLDGERFVRGALAILAGTDASVANFARGRGDAALPAWATAGDGQGPSKKAGVVLLGRTRAGALIAVRRAPGDLAIIDYAQPWARAGGAGRDTRNARSGVAGLLPRLLAPPRQSLASALAQGTRRLLSTEDVSVALVIAPDALSSLFPRAACRKDWGGADGALFEDVAVLLRLHPFQWRLETAWTLTPLGRTRLAGAAADDGLLDAPTAAGDGIAAAGLLLDGFEAVRGAPRPPALAGKAERALESLQSCGPVAWLAAAARFWPQLVALEVEHLTAPARGGVVLGGLRNVAAVLRQLPDNQHSWESSTVLLGSLPATAESNVTGLLTQQASGRPETQAFGQRLPTFFDLSASTGFSEAGLERIAGGHLALALTPQAAGLGWYYRLARKPARFGPQTKIGYLHLNLARLLGAWAEDADQGTRAAVRTAAAQLGQLGGNMTLDGDFVRLDLNLSGNQ